MKKKLQLLFTFALIYFVSADLSAQVYLLTDKTDIDCNSSTGSITVYTINEFLNPPPYTYRWSNGADTSTISNLGPGTYSVLVTDANKQTGSASVTINAYKAIAVQTNASCSGASSGSATVAVKNGSGSYSYSWNTVPEQTTQSVTGLAAGSYTVTVTDNSLSNCKTTASVNIKLNPSVPAGDPDVYGSNLWNVYAWNEGTFNSLAWSSAYSGYFTADALDFNSEDYFEDYDVPSSVANYQGCPVNGDNHSWSAKRKGFPCGYYKIDIPMHDDWVRLYIDGQIVFQDNNCCESHTNVWEGFLNSESKVEFRIAEERGQSRGSIKFNLIEPTAVIVNASCYGENDGSISLTPITADTYAYEWENGLTEKDRTGLSAGNYTVIITMPNGCTETKTYTVSQPNALTVTATQSDVTGCHGGNNGSITATVAGGSGNYTYQWNTIPVQTDPALTGLSAGTYTVTVTDANSCQTSKSFTIAEPSAISGTAVITNVSCNGGDNGAIDFTPTGGNGSYTYNWGDGVTTQDRTGLTAGTYSVTVTDSNNCNQTINNIVVGQPAVALTASPVAQTNIACRGGSTGSATVTAAGGAGGYTYLWAPSGGTAATASGLTAGTYTVTVTDANNCQAAQAFTIVQPAAALTATAGTINNTSCYGGGNGTATVIASGGTPNYSYSWNTAPVQTTATASGLSAGTYTVTVTDFFGCQATRSFTISEPSALTIAPSQT
ncbi:SprB repeat-containing protein, partial [Flavobacterium ginsenosidimutans]|uniref:SprB repeat-containing protein n=1 Tax=Flavobacterium ginsenosidimutans TaxID=687844 RepID=UPI00194F1CE8